MYFADSILFRGIFFFISFNFCAILLIVFMRRFKGYLAISASAARYQSTVSDMVEPFFSTLSSHPGSFPKSCLEQLFCKRPVSARSSKKELPTKPYLRNFPEFLNYYSSLKVVVCRPEGTP